MQGKPTSFWSKLKKDESGEILGWHPLVDHLADVGACCEALLQLPLLNRRLARLGGIDALDEITIARLSFLASLHDIGKFNTGFQDGALSKKAPRIGHVWEFWGIFSPLGDKSLKKTLIELIKLREMLSWLKKSPVVKPDQLLMEMIASIICHHGKPIPLNRHTEPPPSKDLWEAKFNLEPIRGLEQAITKALEWFPGIFDASQPSLPANHQFYHAFNGLVTLADWIASTETFFPYSNEKDGDRIDLARQSAKNALDAMGLTTDRIRAGMGNKKPGFSDISSYKAPRPLQVLIQGLPYDESGDLVLLESETGSGKTEAALIRFIQLFHAGKVDGIYFALPTRTSAMQIYKRVCAAINRCFPDYSRRPPVILAVPGYLGVDGQERTRPAGFEHLWDDDENYLVQARGWAAEQPKRYFTGSVIIGTIDQALFSTLMVKHSHLRATALLRHLLVVDEVHASDVYMTEMLLELVRRQLECGGYVLLMSATLGSAMRARFLYPPHQKPDYAKHKDDKYPLITLMTGKDTRFIPIKHTLKTKIVDCKIKSIIDQHDQVALMALDAATKGAKVLVLRNTVDDCIKTQQALEQAAYIHNKADLLYKCKGVITCHHSRFAEPDRQDLDKAIEKAVGKDAPNKGCVVVATQTVQQSLDLDSDMMITDLCPMDVLLQRIGRLHRHEKDRPQGFEKARLIVLTPQNRDISSYISKKGRHIGRSRGKHGLGSVYYNLLSIEATWRLIEKNECIIIPDMCRSLVEGATNPLKMKLLANELGGKWITHLRYINGLIFAQTERAGLNIIDWGISYAEISFPSNYEDIKTRLDADDRIAKFPDEIELTSPFGNLITKIIIPGHIVNNIDIRNEVEDINIIEKGFSFIYNSTDFIYTRHGLQLRNQ